MTMTFYAFANKFDEDVFIKGFDESEVHGLHEAMMVTNKKTADALLDTYLSAERYQVIEMILHEYKNGVAEWEYCDVPEGWL